MGFILRAVILVAVTFVARKILELVFDMLKERRARQDRLDANTPQIGEIKPPDVDSTDNNELL